MSHVFRTSVKVFFASDAEKIESELNEYLGSVAPNVAIEDIRYQSTLSHDGKVIYHTALVRMGAWVDEPNTPPIHLGDSDAVA